MQIQYYNSGICDEFIFSSTIWIYFSCQCFVFNIDRQLLLDALEIEGSTIDIKFTLNMSRPISDYSADVDDGFVHYFYEFSLKIKNASTEDDGVYTCTAITPWMDIVVSCKHIYT